MIEVEQNGKQYRKRNCDEDIGNPNMPEVYKPPSIRRWKKCLGRWQSHQANLSHLSYMNETREKYDCKWCTVIFYEDSNVMLE